MPSGFVAALHVPTQQSQNPVHKWERWTRVRSPAQTAAATPSAGEIASRWTARSGFRGREWATYRSALLPGPTDQSCDQINLLAGGKGSRSGLRCAVDGISNLWTFGEA